ncbi:MAG: peptide chain release factor N(5)-glutamine methyltransferase [Sedimentisphaerales bacterium]|nr:peptide chain release factor N(5)-glutamine methyltransferase [Sedimentisphaerales bacterium]
MESWTINKLLVWIHQYLKDKGIESPRLHAELLLSNILGLKRIELYTQHDKQVSKQDLDKLHVLVKRAGLHEPIAYLVGKTEFYSLEIEVSKDCLIPRPETELLVQRAIEFLRMRDGIQSVCDLCTGSGCIAVAIAKNFPQANLIATDISDQALLIAARNTEKFNLQNRIKLLSGDLFDPVIPQLDTGKFDLIVSNPPYVSNIEYEKLDKNVKDHEPQIALLAGHDGLDIYKRIIEKVDTFLKPNAALILEIGYAQGKTVYELLDKTNVFSEIRIDRDSQNNDRIVTAIKQHSL